MKKMLKTAFIAFSAFGTAAIAAPPANSPYVTDRVNAYVNEESARSFQTVSEILCMVGQTKAESFIGQGAYIALVDENLCKTQSDAASGANSSTNQSSGSSSPDYTKFIVDVTQADASSPVEMKVWVHNSDEDNGQIVYSLIKAKSVTTQTPSDSNPLGLFQLNFAGYQADSSWTPQSTTAGFKGFLSAVKDQQDRPVLNFYEEELDGNGTEIDKATLLKSGDNSGVGRVEEADGGVTSFNIAFNADEFLRDNGTTNQCFDRNTFNNSVWSYGLYNATTGQRAAVNAGFPITKQVNNRTEYGWASYWGIWMPPGAELAHGDTVTRGSSNTDYTVFKAGGKLIKNERADTTLSELNGVALDWYSSTDNKQYEIAWDGSNFVKSRVMDCGNDGCFWKNASGNVIFTANDYGIYAWSRAINAEIRISLRNNQGGSLTLTNASPATKVTRAVVLPGDTVPSNLSCYSNCLKSDGTTEQGVGYSPNINTVTPVSYTFDTSTMLLSENGAPVVAQSNWSNNGGFSHGFFSGRMVDANSVQTSALACDWDSNQFCGHKIGEQSVFYTWETGTNEWNQLTLLRNSGGDFQTFDPPWYVPYTHTDSTKYVLEYAGHGNLQGIPGKCVNPSTNEDVECGPNTHWVPQFNIADGTTLTYDNTDYLVKWLGYEQRMQQNNTGCSTLAVDTTLSLPNASDWVEPDIGDVPTVTSEPKVIGGVIQ